jgi:hypothetical protein
LTRTISYGAVPSQCASPHSDVSSHSPTPLGSVTFGGSARSAGIVFALRLCCAAIHFLPTIEIFFAFF